MSELDEIYLNLRRVKSEMDSAKRKKDFKKNDLLFTKYLELMKALMIKKEAPEDVEMIDGMFDQLEEMRKITEDELAEEEPIIGKKNKLVAILGNDTVKEMEAMSESEIKAVIYHANNAMREKRRKKKKFERQRREMGV